ncbi:MAG: AAA family ATPase [Pseudomonadota bacterium]
MSANPMHGDFTKLKPRAQQLLGKLEYAREIAPVLETDYLVKGWFYGGQVSLLFGPSNVGKSFLAMDIAHAIARAERWHGRRVQGGGVLYLAAEAGPSLSNRIAALKEPGMWVLRHPLNLAPSSSLPSSDPAALGDIVAHLTALNGPFRLIVVDTLARVMGDRDENLAPDIGRLIHSVDRLKTFTGAHILLVHHSGKDGSKGARGHSALRAAVDTEIAVNRDDEIEPIIATVTKQRDGPTGLKFHFRLKQVVLGQDQDGDDVTTCLVQEEEGRD